MEEVLLIPPFYHHLHTKGIFFKNILFESRQGRDRWWAFCEGCSSPTPFLIVKLLANSMCLNRLYFDKLKSSFLKISQWLTFFGQMEEHRGQLGQFPPAPYVSPVRRQEGQLPLLPPSSGTHACKDLFSDLDLLRIFDLFYTVKNAQGIF